MRDAIDTALDFAVVPGFTRIGHAARSRLYGWSETGDLDATGRTIVVTGATSGLGFAAARELAAIGASVVIVGRSGDRLETARREIADASGSAEIHPVVADLADLDQVLDAARRIEEGFDAVDALVHNAGALTAERQDNDAGIEMTVASQVVGPFALTCHLLPTLRRAGPGRVITMSSGGMYAAPLTVTDLQMPADRYGGSEQYARAKRAQVTLNEMWAERVDPSEVVFHAMHPGWADTPGVQASLPTFARIVGPLLRSADEGADTLVWLTVADEPLSTSGDFWHDRRVRPIHRLGRTRRSDTPERRVALWEWCATTANVDPPLASS